MRMADECKPESRLSEADARELMESRMDRRIDFHMNRFDQSIRDQLRNQHEETVALIKSAYPNGDAVGHRIAHEEWIARMQARRKFIEELTLHLARGGLWAMVLFLAYAAFHAIKIKIIGTS